MRKSYHGRLRVASESLSVGVISVGLSANPSVLRNHICTPRRPVAGAGIRGGDAGDWSLVDALGEKPSCSSGTGRLSADVGSDSLRAMCGFAMVTLGRCGFGPLDAATADGRCGSVGGKMRAGVPIAW